MLQLPRSRLRRIALLALGPTYVAAGVNHLLNPEWYLRMMPPYLPAPDLLVLVSGLLEMVGGVAVFVPRFRSAAGWGLVLLLVAVLPANLHMALHPESFPEIPAFLLVARLPFQLLLMGWAWWATRPEAEASGGGGPLR